MKLCVLLNSSPGREFECWVKCELAQARGDSLKRDLAGKPVQHARSGEEA